MPDRPHECGGGPPAGSPPLILASGSPQRRAILKQIGVDFTVVVSGAPELESGPPEEVALENAYRKARAVADSLCAADGPGGSDGSDRQTLRVVLAGDGQTPGRRILGVDTVVALGAQVYGKPRDASHARETLTRLSGRTHRVISGICLIDAERTRTAAASTEVTFRRLDPALLDWYVATEEWQERAGGYAIQARGAALVSAISGDYLNVVGLPVATLLDLAPDLLQSALRD